MRMRKAAAILLLLVVAGRSTATTGLVWKRLADMPTARSYMGVAVLGATLYAIGGWDGPVLSAVEAYYTETNTWKTRASLPGSREGLGAAAVNGKIYAIGGWNSGVLSTVQVYDPDANSWTTKTSMPTARYALAAAAVNGKIYLMGGYDGSSRLSTVEEYDPVGDSWTGKAPMPTSRMDLPAVTLNSKVYAISGLTQMATMLPNEVYDPLLDSWDTKSIYPPPWRDEAAAAVMDGKVYLMGGYAGGSSVLATVDEYDPLSDTWSSANPLPSERRGSGAATINGKIYIVGHKELLEGHMDNYPVLSWVQEAGYVTDGIEPDRGERNVKYAFKVTYSDLDGDAPEAGYPRVHVSQGGAALAGSPFTMEFISGDYVTGATYGYSLEMPRFGDNYFCYFEAKDIYGAPASGSPTVPRGGPDVTPRHGKVLLAPNVLSRLDPYSHMAIHVSGNGTGLVALDIFDATGKKLRHIDVPTSISGYGTCVFDGRDSKGMRLPVGLYWIVARGGGVDDKKGFAVIGKGR